jgi:phosphotransferase family enzyme
VEAGSVGGGVVAWCRRWLVAEPVQVLFRAGYLSQVTGLRLADGRAVVLKARPPAPRLRGCVAVQATLAAAGFPCPRPPAGPAPLGALAATAEELVPGGHLLAPGPDAAGRFAALLAELVRLAPDPAGLPTLAPSPPWAAWDTTIPGCGRQRTTAPAT